MLEAVVSITPPHSWIKRVTAEFPAVIRVLDCRSLPDGEGVQELFEITSNSDLSERIIDYLRQDSYVYDIDIVRANQGRVIGSLKTHKCTACKAFAGADCFLVSATSKPDGKLEWTVLGNDTLVKSLMHDLEDQKVESSVVKVSGVKQEEELTARQESILQIALEKGYFEFPKKITLRQLAKALDVSPATLTEILRRGQKRIVEEHFKGRPSVLGKRTFSHL
ncbi:MAG TPA: helix-turn-helix domain-containing protein [Candidatus Acidoferrales bacterium]|nr:helix-turn-helix domain-containing protein [Candidatus Acidoferrales bacterium]